MKKRKKKNPVSAGEKVSVILAILSVPVAYLVGYIYGSWMCCAIFLAFVRNEEVGVGVGILGTLYDVLHLCLLLGFLIVAAGEEFWIDEIYHNWCTFKKRFEVQEEEDITFEHPPKSVIPNEGESNE